MRTAARQAFLDRHGWAGVVPEPVAGDASGRRYYRLRRAKGDSKGPSAAVLMDDAAEPAQVGTFAAIAGRLGGLGLAAPVVYAADLAAGFALLEDFGDDCLARQIDAGAVPEPLFDSAVDVLIALHRRFEVGAADAALPRFDPTRFADQAALFLETYLPAVRSGPVTTAARTAFHRAWMPALTAACAVPQSLMLRDYFLGNLMHLPDRPGEQACGLLDFQDAGIGPVTYDLASLVEDARRDVPPAIASRALTRYGAAFPDLAPDLLAASAAILAGARHVRVIAVFTRLAREHGKPAYLAHIPRLWRLLEARLETPALADLKEWFDTELPPARRIVP